MEIEVRFRVKKNIVLVFKNDYYPKTKTMNKKIFFMNKIAENNTHETNQEETKTYLTNYHISNKDLSSMDTLAMNILLKNWHKVYPTRFSPKSLGHVTVNKNW